MGDEWPEQDLSRRGLNCVDTFEHNNLFVKYLPSEMDSERLGRLFAPFGEVESAVVSVNPTTNLSLGYGFVRFKEASDAISAMNELHGMSVPPNKTLLVEPALKTQGQPRPRQQKGSNNLYIKNLLSSTCEDDLREIFGQYGKVTECKVLIDKATSASKRIGFVRMESDKAAITAMRTLNGFILEQGHPPLFIRFAEAKGAKMKRTVKAAAPPQKSCFRSDEQVLARTSNFDDKVDGGINLFVFHLPESWNDSNLHHIFAKYGHIVSAKVMVHLYGEKAGLSKGFGFVKFRDAHDGLSAMTDLHGFKVKGKKLSVQLKKSA